VEGHGLHIHCLNEFVTTLCRLCEGWPRFVVSPEMCRTPICSTGVADEGRGVRGFSCVRWLLVNAPSCSES
jgi:hypothetical protein